MKIGIVVLFIGVAVAVMLLLHFLNRVSVQQDVIVIRIREGECPNLLFIFDVLYPCLKVSDDMLVVEAAEHCYFPLNTFVLLGVSSIESHLLYCINILINLMFGFEYPTGSSFTNLVQLLKILFIAGDLINRDRDLSILSIIF